MFARNQCTGPLIHKTLIQHHTVSYAPESALPTETTLTPPESFYTRLLQKQVSFTKNLYIFEFPHWSKLLRRKSFTQRTLYTRKLCTTGTVHASKHLFHQQTPVTCTPKQLWHQKPYTKQLPPETLSTKNLCTRTTFCTWHLLHQKPCHNRNLLDIFGPNYLLALKRCYPFFATAVVQDGGHPIDSSSRPDDEMMMSMNAFLLRTFVSIWCQSPFEWVVGLLTAQCLFPPSMVMLLVDRISSKSQAKIPDFHLPRGCHRQQLIKDLWGLLPHLFSSEKWILCCWTNIFHAFWDELSLWIILSMGPWHGHILTYDQCKVLK